MLTSDSSVFQLHSYTDTSAVLHWSFSE